MSKSDADDINLTSSQKNSRSGFLGSGNIHEALSLKYEWYQNWHEKPFSHMVHWIILLLVTLLVTLIAVFTVFGSHASKIKAASKQSWDSLSSWNDWKLENIVASESGLSLKSTTDTADLATPKQFVSSGSATYTFDPAGSEVVDWLSADSITNLSSQNINAQFSTDSILFTDKIESLANSAKIYIKISLSTVDPTITPTLSSLAINYSRLPQAPKDLSFRIDKKILTTTQTLLAGSFSDPDGDEHQASQWQVTKSSGDYANTVLDSGTVDDARSLEGYRIEGNLPEGQYFFRVRYEDSTGAWSLWSDECAFTVEAGNKTTVSQNDAVKTDPREMIEKRTETTKTLKNDDGTYTLDSYSGVIHYKDNYNDPNAQWKDVNPNHSIDTPEYVLFDAMPSTVKVFKDKIGYEIQSRRTGETYDVVLDSVDGTPNLSLGKGTDGRVAWANINTPSEKPASPVGGSKVKSQNLGDWILPQAMASENQVTRDQGNLKFEFEISASGVRLWKTINGDDAPKNFKWKVTKTGAGNDLRFRDKPDAFELDSNGNADDHKRVKIDAKRIAGDANNFTWQETAPSTDLKIDTDVVFNPDQYGYTTMDGWVSAQYYSYSSYDWATITGQSWGGNASNSDSYSSSAAGWDGYNDGNSDGFGNLYRSMYLFDTSSIPDTGTISAATFSVYGYSKQDDHSWAPSLNVYSASPSSNTSISSNDYPSFGSTAFSDTAISYSSYSTSGYNNLALNATGKAAISKSGVTKLGLRTTADATGSSPTVFGSGSAYFGVDFAESGTSTTPKLAVTYSGGATVSGTIYTNTNKSTNVGAGVSVSIERNGSSSKRTVQTTAGGAFSFGGFEIANNDVLAIFTDGSNSYTSLVTVASGTGDITGLELFTGNTVLKGSITNSNLQTASQNYDSWLGFSAYSDASFQYGLYIPSGSTYTPGGAVTVAASYSGDINLLGTITMGSYNLTGGYGYFYLSGGTFNAGSGQHNFGTYVQTSGTFNSNTSSSIYFSSSFSMSGGTFNGNSSSSLNLSTTSISGGTFNAGSATIYTYDFTISSGSFDGGTSALHVSGNNFYLTGGSFKASSGNTYADYSVTQLTISNTFDNNNGTFVLGTSNYMNMTIGSNAFYNLTFDCGNSCYGGVAFPTNANVANNLTLANGNMLTASGLTTKNYIQTGGTLSIYDSMTVTGNWTFSGGSINDNPSYSSPCGSTVAFTGNPTITGSSTFCNFTADTAGKTLTFAAGSTQTIEGTLNIMGTATGTTSLVSGTPGTYWHINPTGTVQIANAAGYVNVTDSYNDNATAIATLNTGTSANITRVSHDFNWADASSTCTWDGGGSDNNWSTAANWSGDTTPSDICDAIFDGTSTKASTIDSGFTNHIRSLSLNSGYTNTVTGGADLNVDGSVNLAAGTFAPGSHTVYVGGDWNNTGGTFTKGTSTVSMIGSGQSGAVNTNGTGTGKDFYNLTVAGSSYSTFDSYTSLMLHGDGTNGSNTITDSAKGHSVTAHGGAQIRTDQSKFGGASMYFNAYNSDYITTSTSTDYDFGSGDFTIDTWVRFPSLPPYQESASGYQPIAEYGTDGDNRWALYLDNRPSQGSKRGFRFDLGLAGVWGTLVDAGDMASLSANTWYHIAVVRNGTSWKMYKNGTQSASGTYSTTIPHFTGNIQIGTEWDTNNATNAFYIDEFRISTGIARWTSGFTVPSSAYSPDVTYAGIYNCSADTVVSNNLDVYTGTLGCGSNNLTVGNYIQGSGTFTAPGAAKSFTVNGGWDHTGGGTFNPNSGTVTLTGDSAVQGNTTFNNLTHTTGGKTITVAASSTQTISGTLTLQGANGNNLVLVSSSPGTRWNITPNGTISVQYVTVSDSTSSTAINASNSSEGTPGSTTNWMAGSAPTVTTQSASSITSSGATGNGNITSTGGANATVRGFEYATDSSGGHDCTSRGSTSTASDSGSYSTGAYTKAITGLAANTYYCARAYATNPTGTGYGSWVSFQTLDNVPTAASNVTIGSISATGFTVSWTDNSSNETGFKVYITAGSSCSSSGSPDYTAAANATNQVVTGKSVNTQYCARVVATNGSGDGTTADSASSKYTLANTPSAPTLGTPTTSALPIVINQNSNPSNTTYSIKIVYGATTKYVATNGTLSDSAVWDTYANFGSGSGVSVSSLSANTQYTVSVAARNGDSTATSYSSTTAKYTLTNTPSAPTVNATSSTSLTVIISDNSSTAYAIRETNSGNYVQADGTLGISAVYASYSSWGSGSGKLVTGLSVHTSYTFTVYGQNGDSVATSASSGTSQTTLDIAPTAATGVTITNIDSTYFDVTWTDNSNNETGFKVYVAVGSTCTTDGIYSGTPDFNASTNATSQHVTGKSINTQYCAKVVATNSIGDSSAAYSSAKYTLANQPGTPTVTAYDWDSTYHNNLKSVITGSENNNPSGTTYAISCDTGGTTWFDGSQGCNGTPTWKTIAQWETGHVNYIANLNSNTLYSIKLEAKNGDGVTTSLSASAGTAMTAPAQVTFPSPNHTANTTSQISWDWNDASGAASYKIYNNSDSLLSSPSVSNYDQGSLSTNTQYTVYVKAVNSGGLVGQQSSNASAYTSIESATGITFGAISESSIAVTATGSFSNLTSGSSGLYITKSGGAGTGFASWNTSNNTLTNTSLSPNTQYTYTAQTRNGDGETTTITSDFSKYTYANVPSAPTVSSASITSINIVINQNSNPSGTRYAIYNQTAGKYVKHADGTLQDAEDWQTYTDWGADSGFVNIGLSSGTSYTYKVKAENNEGTPVVTAFSATASASTANAITVSGTLYASDGTTPVSGRTIAVSVNGGAIASTAQSAGDGTFSVSNVIAGTNEPLVVFVNEPGYEANIYTLAKDGNTNITGLSLVVGQIILRSETVAHTITNANVKSTLACATGQNCGSHLHFTNPTGSKINYDEGYQLVVDTGMTYTPGAEIGTIGSLRIKGTLSLGTDPVTITGDLNATGGTITQTDSTINFTNSSGTQTITSAGQEFGSVAFSNNGTRAISGNMVVNGTFSQTGGNLNLSQNPNVTIKNNVDLTSGSITKGSGVMTLAGNLHYNTPTGLNPGAVAIGASPDTVTLTSDATYDSLTINLGDTLVTSGYNVTVANNLVINGSLDASSASGRDSVISVGGNWTNNGTFTKGNSTVTLAGADSSTQVISGNSTFNNLVASTSSNSAGRTIQYAGSSTTTVTGNWTMTGASGKILTLERKTADSGSWTINATTPTVSYASVTNSTNSGSAFCATNSSGSSDSGWYFSSGSSCNSTVQFTSSSSSGSEAVTSVNIELSLGAAEPNNVSVDYAVTGGTATGGGVDYTLASGTATITAGNTTTNISLAIVNDTLAENSETIVISLSNPVNASIGTNSSYTYTILDNDTDPTVAFNSTSSSGAESTTSVNLPVSLSTASGKTITVNYSVTGGTANGSGVDYTLSSGTLTFNPGDTTKNITMAVVDDSLFENNETVQVTLASPTNATLDTNTTHTYTINDNDSAPTVTLELSGSPLAENGGAATVTARLSAVSGKDTTVHLSYSGTAVNLTDYTRSDITVVVGAGTSTNAITLTGINNPLYTGNKTIIVDISSVDNGTESGTQQVTATIADGQSAPTIQFSTTSGSGSESAASPTITLQLSTISGLNSSVHYSVSGTATGGGVDYTLADGTATINAGQTTTTIPLSVIDDQAVEGDETVVITLTSPTNCTLGSNQIYTYTIVDNDILVLPAIGFTTTSGSGLESVTSKNIGLILSESSSSDTTVAYAITTGGAYASASGTATIAAGQTTTTIPLTITNNSLYEPSKTVVVTLSSPSNAELNSNTQYTYTILNDDPEPSVSLSVNHSSIAEAAGTSTVTATLSAASGMDSVVTFGFAGTAVNTTNYTRSNGSITITAGQTTGSITLTAVQNAIYEDNKTIIVSVANATNATIGSPSTQTVTILDDDNPPMVTLEMAGSPMVENGGSATVTARLDAVSGKDTTVHLAFAGSATYQTDYTASDTNIVIGAGTTSNAITLTAIRDSITEGDENILVTIASVDNGIETGTQHVEAVITDGTVNAPLVPNVTMLINSGATRTTSPNIRLTIASETGTEMKISNASDLTGASWQPIVSPKSWTLDSPATSGEKTVYIKVRNASLVESTTVSAKINLELASSGVIADTTPPSAPTNLVALGSRSVISLTWNNPTDSDFAKILIFRSTSAGFVPDQNSNLIGATTSASTDSYFDANLDPNTTYYYKIRAVDTVGNLSAASNEVFATPSAPIAAAPEKKNTVSLKTVFESVGQTNEIVANATNIPEKDVPIAAAATAVVVVSVAAAAAAPVVHVGSFSWLIHSLLLTGSVKKKKQPLGNYVSEAEIEDVNPKIEKTLSVISTIMIAFGTLTLISGFIKDQTNSIYIGLALLYPLFWYIDTKAIINSFDLSRFLKK